MRYIGGTQRQGLVERGYPPRLKQGTINCELYVLRANGAAQTLVSDIFLHGSLRII